MICSVSGENCLHLGLWPQQEQQDPSLVYLGLRKSPALPRPPPQPLPPQSAYLPTKSSCCVLGRTQSRNRIFFFIVLFW